MRKTERNLIVCCDVICRVYYILLTKFIARVYWLFERKEDMKPTFCVCSDDRTIYSEHRF